MAVMSGHDLANELSKFVNCFHNREEKRFVDEVTTDHRTLQQNTFNLICVLIQEWASRADNGNYDARNEYTVKTCKEILEKVPQVSGQGPCI